MYVDKESIEVQNNKSASRFEVNVEGIQAVLDYMERGHRIIFTHTGVPTELGGQGVGSLMAQTALEYAKTRGLEVVPLCPFVKGYIQQHTEYQSLVHQMRG